MTAMASNKGSSIRARLSGQARLVSSVRAGRLLFRRQVGLNLTHPLARKNTPGVVRAGGSDLSSLFDGTGSSKESKNEAKDDGEVKEVELNSELGLDYSLLRDLLAAGEWEKADDETRLKLIEMAGEEAVIRGWVYFTEVKDIPIADLRTVDDLWLSYSKGRYGYSVQKKAWVKSRKVWTKFFQEIDWVQGENNAYRKWPLEFNWVADAKKGHLPLTNALRGTQLLQAVLEHPAFEEKKKKKVNTSATTSVKI